jgi:hypothetical protein
MAIHITVILHCVMNIQTMHNVTQQQCFITIRAQVTVMLKNLNIFHRYKIGHYSLVQYSFRLGCLDVAQGAGLKEASNRLRHFRKTC